MLNLFRFRLLWKQQQRTLFPGWNPIPKGYKPPSRFDPHRDPTGKGYREGTIRRWQNGLHIKLKGEWFPYDPKAEAAFVGNKWVPVGEKARIPQRRVPEWDQIYEAEQEAKDVFRDYENDKIDEHEAAAKLKEIGEAFVHFTEELWTFSPMVPEIAKSQLLGDYGGWEDFSELRVDLDDVEPFDELKKDLDKLEPEYSSLDIVTRSISAYVESEEFDAIVNAASTVEEIITPGLRKNVAGAPDEHLLKAGGILAKMGAKGKVELFYKQGAASRSFLRTTEEGAKAIQKYDVLSVREGTFRQSLEGETPSLREAAAYDVAKLFGWKIVPETEVMKDYLPPPEEMQKVAEGEALYILPLDEINSADEKFYGSCQRFVENSEALADVVTDSEKRLLSWRRFLFPSDVERMFGKKALDDAWRIAILHAIVANTDGHAGNVLVDKDGHMYSIDHGLIFGPGQERSIFDGFDLDEVPDHIKEELREAVETGEVRATLEAYGAHATADRAEEILERILNPEDEEESS